MQADAIKPGQTVVVIDDLIATGALRFFSVRRAWRAQYRSAALQADLQRRRANS